LIKRATVYFVFCVISFLFCSGSLCAQSYPRRIISLGPSITEELYLLGAGDHLVGCTTYCKRPEAKLKERVGKAIEVDLEKVIALKPDIVFATSLTDPRAVNRMRELGVKVVVFPEPKDFQEICNQFVKLARLIGREGKAKEIISRVKARVTRFKEEVKGLNKPKVFVEVGVRPLFTATGDSFINDFIKLAGGINIAAHARSGLYSREKVLEENPDVIIIVTMGIVGQKEKSTWEKFKTIKAVREGRVYVVDSYKLCSPTPVTFVEFLGELVRLLHPELKGKNVGPGAAEGVQGGGVWKIDW